MSGSSSDAPGSAGSARAAGAAGAADAAGSSGAAGSADASQRAVPYHCPFCAEEDLRPVASGEVAGLTRGGWHCRSCLRVFSVAYHGIHNVSEFVAVPELSRSDRS